MVAAWRGLEGLGRWRRVGGAGRGRVADPGVDAPQDYVAGRLHLAPQPDSLKTGAAGVSASIWKPKVSETVVLFPVPSSSVSRTLVLAPIRSKTPFFPPSNLPKHGRWVAGRGRHVEGRALAQDLLEDLLRPAVDQPLAVLLGEVRHDLEKHGERVRHFIERVRHFLTLY